jgi:flagellar hook-basal body complex protein FliE
MISYMVGSVEGNIQGPKAPAGPRYPQAERDFSAEMEAALEKVDAMQEDADQMVQAVASGQDVNLHGMAISLEKADVAFRTMITTRNKVVEAYQAVMNMSI